MGGGLVHNTRNSLIGSWKAEMREHDFEIWRFLGGRLPHLSYQLRGKTGEDFENLVPNTYVIVPNMKQLMQINSTFDWKIRIFLWYMCT